MKRYVLKLLTFTLVILFSAVNFGMGKPPVHDADDDGRDEVVQDVVLDTADDESESNDQADVDDDNDDELNDSLESDDEEDDNTSLIESLYQEEQEPQYSEESDFDYETFSQLPSANVEQFFLQSPTQNLISINPTINVNGWTRTSTDVYINNTLVSLTPGGHFEKEIVLPNPGKHTLYITFTTPHYEPITLHRNVWLMQTPNDIDSVVDERQSIIYYYNSPLIPDQRSSLSEPITRAQFAYFLSNWSGTTVSSPDLAIYNDVDEDNWAAPYIQFATHEKLIMEFPDGSFKPNTPINTLEYILAMDKLTYQESDQTSVLEIEGLSSAHWLTPKASRLVLKDLLQIEGALLLETPVTLLDLMNWTSNHQRVKEIFLDMQTSFESSEASNSQNKQAILEPILAELQIKQASQNMLSQLRLDSPKDSETILGEYVEFQGMIKPNSTLTINAQIVSADLKGEFTHILNLEPGKHTVTLNYLDEETQLTLTLLPKYLDMSNHWAEISASELSFLGVLDQTPNFFPKNPVTNGEFAHYVTTIYAIPVSQHSITTNATVDDTANDYSGDIEALQKLGFVKKGSNMLINSTQFITKRDAVTLLANLSKVALEGDDEEIVTPVIISNTPYPELEITLKKAAKLGLLKGSKSFTADKVLTRAECAILLGRLPVIQEKLKEALYD